MELEDPVRPRPARRLLKDRPAAFGLVTSMVARANPKMRSTGASESRQFPDLNWHCCRRNAASPRPRKAISSPRMSNRRRYVVIELPRNSEARANSARFQA